MIWKSSDIELNGINTRDYDVKPRKRVEVPTPEEDVEYIDIKGRDSSLTRKNGYKDIPLSVEFYMFGNINFKSAYRKAKQQIMRAQTLRLTDDIVFLKVKSVSFSNAINPDEHFGEFVVDFVLDPFQYEVINDPITITGQRTIINDGHEALPILTATVAGTGKIYINDQEVTIQNVNGTIVIDSEMQNAYRKTSVITESMNKHMIGKFPVLESGSNVVRFDGDVSKLEVIANRRWV